MTNDLSGKKIAFLVANEGIEQVELTAPWQAVKDAGGEPVLLAPESGKAQAFNHLDKADAFDVDVVVGDATVGDYAGLVLPGGVANPDNLRTHDEAVAFVRDFAAGGGAIAAICHAPWTLIEAGLTQGKNVTSWPSLRTDLENSGATWHDTEVFRCPTQGFVLITSRNPDDLPAFSAALVEEFAG